MLPKLFIRRKLLSQNKLRIVINETRACVTRACIHGDIFEIISLDHGTVYIMMLVQLMILANLIEKWISILSLYFLNLPPRKNPPKFEPNCVLQVFPGFDFQLPLCFIILIDKFRHAWAILDLYYAQQATILSFWISRMILNNFKDKLKVKCHFFYIHAQELFIKR